MKKFRIPPCKNHSLSPKVFKEAPLPLRQCFAPWNRFPVGGRYLWLRLRRRGLVQLATLRKVVPESHAAYYTSSSASQMPLRKAFAIYWRLNRAKR